MKFEGHNRTITSMVAKNKKIFSMRYDILYSSSLDGCVRAFDIEVSSSSSF